MKHLPIYFNRVVTYYIYNANVKVNFKIDNAKYTMYQNLHVIIYYNVPSSNINRS